MWSIPSRRGLLGIWITVALAFGGDVTASHFSYGPLDDPNQAYQRPGFLDARPLPRHPNAPFTGLVQGRRAVVFFVRPAQLGNLERALSGDRALRREADLAVVDSSMPPTRHWAVPVLADQSGRLASLFAMRAPNDGGAPVGYAVLDSSGRERYATLDPGVADRLGEVTTILAATP